MTDRILEVLDYLKIDLKIDRAHFAAPMLADLAELSSKGTKPADLPIERQEKFELVVNWTPLSESA